MEQTTQRYEVVIVDRVSKSLLQKSRAKGHRPLSPCVSDEIVAFLHDMRDTGPKHDNCVTGRFALY